MSKNRVHKFFDSYAGDFDALYSSKKSFFHRIINRYFRKSMKVRYEKVLEYTKANPETTVLDVGCGPGHYSIALASKGVKNIIGLDLAPSMIQIANEKAKDFGVAKKCHFEVADFMIYSFSEKFDYLIVMGVMDYISNPSDFICRVHSLTKKKAFFSFPQKGGLLAWQRKIRYKNRCDLFLYDNKDLQNFFNKLPNSNFFIERISRDYFVTLTIL